MSPLDSLPEGQPTKSALPEAQPIMPPPSFPLVDSQVSEGLDHLETNSWAVPEQRSLPDVISERLLNAMRSGELKPGERMIETALAAKLNVSRAPLREAMRGLEAQHLLETRKGKGTFVVELDTEEMAQVSSLRAAIEGWAARLCCARCVNDADACQRLRAAHAQVEAAAMGAQSSLLRSYDWQFHRLVCELSQNALLLRTWDSISSLVRLFQQHNATYVTHPDHVVEHHRRFLDALLGGRPATAEAVFRRILLRSAQAKLGVKTSPAVEDLVSDSGGSDASGSTSIG